MLLIGMVIMILAEKEKSLPRRLAAILKTIVLWPAYIIDMTMIIFGVFQHSTAEITVWTFLLMTMLFRKVQRQHSLEEVLK